MSVIGFTIWLFNIAMENPLWMEVLPGKSSINGPFSIAMLNRQRVYKGVSTNGVTPIAGWLIRENPTNMDDLWYP